MSHLIEELAKKYDDLKEVLDYIEQVRADLLENAEEFQVSEPHSPQEALAVAMRGGTAKPSFRRYQVNVIVDNGNCEGAPIVYEDLPTHTNVMGRRSIRILRNCLKLRQISTIRCREIGTTPLAVATGRIFCGRKSKTGWPLLAYSPSFCTAHIPSQTSYVGSRSSSVQTYWSSPRTPKLSPEHKGCEFWNPSFAR